MELAKGRIFKKNYVIFAAKIWMRKLYFQSQVFHLPFIFLNGTGFKFFARIMGENYVFCCSSHISLTLQATCRIYSLETFSHHYLVTIISHHMKYLRIHKLCSISVLPIIYWPSFKGKISVSSSLSTSWRGMKLQLKLRIPVDKWS